ncbi:hypothetical protein RHGRI_033362 [Rhododendron griersonianum]|uniref:Uncharacterized protein n=1 Tax=Rhododendron griersonianum TaxID=479676 RepID=A0AAV6HZK9_9ERIC|nr:hypothetical protein RHGRI_033362 [Rhododendron griersonianum]
MILGCTCSTMANHSVGDSLPTFGELLSSSVIFIGVHITQISIFSMPQYIADRKIVTGLQDPTVSISAMITSLGRKSITGYDSRL